MPRRATLSVHLLFFLVLLFSFFFILKLRGFELLRPCRVTNLLTEGTKRLFGSLNEKMRSELSARMTGACTWQRDASEAQQAPRAIDVMKIEELKKIADEQEVSEVL